MMFRWWAAVLVVVGSWRTAAADDEGLLRLAIGGSLPTSDRGYSKRVDASPSLDGSVGLARGAVIGLASASVTALQFDPSSNLLAFNNSSLRLRFLAHLGFQQQLAPAVTAMVRIGAGFDVTRSGYDLGVGGFIEHRDDTETGLALEAAAGAWVRVGIGVQLGGELALPMAFHGSHNDGYSPLGFDYSSTELELLLGVRITSRRD